MPFDAIIFMAVTWGGVISLAVYCYAKMLTERKSEADEDFKFPSDPVK